MKNFVGNGFLLMLMKPRTPALTMIRSFINVLRLQVQYFDEELNKVVIDHLGSRQVNVATAKNIYRYDAVTSILNERQLNWTQVVSCLIDNYNTMRGRKGGVKTLIKITGNEHLLDPGHWW